MIVVRPFIIHSSTKTRRTSPRQAVSKSDLGVSKKKMALQRLDFASKYIDGMRRLQTLLRPGRLVIVDLSDEYTEKTDTLRLFVVMLQIFAEAAWQDEPFSKLVVFDEAHKYIANDGLVDGLVEIVREMRHKATSILVASQDPPSVPVALIELSTQLYLHRFNSPAWLKHIQKANSALRHLEPEDLSRLASGEAFVWASKANDAAFTHGTVNVNCRPQVTLHGGNTRTATGTGNRLRHRVMDVTTLMRPNKENIVIQGVFRYCPSVKIPTTR